MFAENIIKEQNNTLTENGCLALNSTNSALVDLFAQAGALRNRRYDEIIDLFSHALLEDKLLATKLAFYTRDIRNGLGERRTGKIMFNYLANQYPEILDKNIALLPEYGRWDDLTFLAGVSKKGFEIVKKQLASDIVNMKENKSISLLAKWLPSINASSKATVFMGKKYAQRLGMSEKEYRKTLASLRRYLNVVECNLSSKDYNKINYAEVPSKAMNIYRNAFVRHDEQGFNQYLEDVKNHIQKINSSVLYPYDIVEKYLYKRKREDAVLEEQWKALPNYVDENSNFLVMADVSGSMYGRPMATSVGLAIYFAEKNKGTFGNKFMTFSNKPKLINVKGNTLYEKVRFVQSADWNMNTNLEAAFDLILRTAERYKTKQEDLPTSIIVITDMEFDACCNSNWYFYDVMKEKFEDAGYKIPNIVFWNVNARNSTYHASCDKKGVQLASGQSTTVFKTLVDSVNLTPYEYMLKVLNDKRYDAIKV